MEYSAGFVKEILTRHGKTLSHSLGQNFMFDGKVLNTIVDEAVETGEENILEIGAGVGMLTSLLCEKAKKVVTVEIDDSLEDILVETVGHPNFTLHSGDILKVDMAEISCRYFNGEPFVIVGNLPYYITTKIFDKLCLNTHHFTKAVIMVQKEFGDRLATPTGDKLWRAASLQAQTLFDIKKNCVVPPHLFVPPPHVDSAVITLIPKEHIPVKEEDIPAFLRFTDLLFAARRKQLKSIAPSFGVTSEKIAQALASLDLPVTARGEILAPQAAVALFEKLQSGTTG